ncbi:MAG: LLM class flavin-dependent oxidoreductase [Alphaproteobacteria bacterium]|nr:LLM class flavin-dependent oxidoreductase [Alphaproteobacteria bacterium]
MNLPLGETYHYGLMTRFPTIEATRAITAKLDALKFDSVWVGDHIAFTTPIMDPFLQLAQIAACSDRLTVGSGVFLLPLRHPTPVAKQTATLDHLSGGRFIFGVGVGGEFPREFEACGVPHNERGARLEEGIEVVRKLWRGEPVSHDGTFYSFPEVHMQPATLTPEGPPIWFGGRSDAALRRTGRMGDGWISYVVTPEMYKNSLDKIAPAFEKANRDIKTFGTAHLLFAQIDNSYEAALDKATELLSKRYAMDFRGPAKKYAALGRPEDVAEAISKFHDAGVRHVNFDFLGPPEERDAQLDWFAAEVRPLLGKG